MAKLTEEQLKQYDLILLIDKSKSMETPDVKNRTRWDACREQTEGWARDAQQYDQNGLTVGFFSDSFTIHENVTSDKVVQIFTEHKPSGSTETHEVMEHVLNQYLKGDRKKPIIVLVITDGAASDNKKLAKVIADATQKMNRDEEIGIQFIRIGNDPGAKQTCEYLDDKLQSEHNAKFDIVDTNTFEEAQKMTFLDLCDKTLSD